LATIKDADKIFVLQDGKIVEAGTHQQLIDNKGSYSNYVKLQSIS